MAAATTETSHMTMMTTTDKYMPGMNGSNGSTTTETSHMTVMTTTDKYMPGMNVSNGSTTTTETSHMTMMTTTDMYMPGMNGSNGSTTTETITTTMLVFQLHGWKVVWVCQFQTRTSFQNQQMQFLR